MIKLEWISIFALLFLITSSSIIPKQPNFLVFYVEDINMLNGILHPGMLSETEKLSGYNQKLLELYDSFHLEGFRELLDSSVVFTNMFGEISSTATTAALLTGTNAVHTGFIQGKILPFKEIPSLASTGGIPENTKTIADLFCGYTKSYIGYWKLGFGDTGVNYPTKHGFDYWTGIATPHSAYCKGVNQSEKVEIGGFRYQYLDIMYKTLPLWLTVSCAILLLYGFNQLSLKSTFDCLLYLYCGTFIFYLLLEAFVAIKPASCVLYQDSTILSQPYNTENLTLHLTSSAINLINVAEDESNPFYIHLNYLQMRRPYFASKFFNENTSHPLQKFINSVLELDWSIYKILKTLRDNNQFSNTVIVLTGGNDCEHMKNSEDTMVYKRNFAENFDWRKVHQSSTLKKCFTVPFLMLWKKAERRTISQPVSITDVFNTFLHIANIRTIHQSTGHSLLPLIINKNQQHFGTTDNFVKSILGEVPESEMNTNNSMSCRTYTIEQEFEIASRNHAIMNYPLRNRTLFFYQTIVKPSALLLESRYWIVTPSRLTGSPQSVMVLDTLKDKDVISQLSNSTLESYYQQAVVLSEQHISNRKNRWSSQFEMPLYPWLFPCANFPTCREVFDMKIFPALEPFDIKTV